MTTATDTKIQDIPLEQLRPSPTNPRKFFDQAKLKELAESIKQHGVLSAIWIRKIEGSGGVKVNGLYEIIAGERRFRASKLAGIESMPCEIKAFDDKQVAEVQIIENLQRDDLSPLEEARGYKPLIEQHGYDIKVLAEKVGKSASYIYGCFRLMKLSPAWHKAMDEGEVKAAFAHVVATRIEDHQLQDQILEDLKDGYEEYSADTAEELRKIIEEKHDRSLKRAPWNTSDKTLVGGACMSCPHRSQAQAELFDGASKGDFCMKGSCWTEKMKEHGAKLVEAAKKQGKNVIAGPQAKKTLELAKKGQGDLVELDSSPSWYHRAGSLREGLKGRPVQVTLVQDDKGKLRQLASRKEVEKVMPKESGAGYGGGSSTGKMSAKEKASRRARLLDLKASREAWPKAWTAAIDKLTAKGLNAIAFRQMLTILVRRHGDRHWTDNAAERMGIKHPGGYSNESAKAIARWLDGKTEKDLVRVGWQLALGAGAYDGETVLSDSGKDIFDLAGVDYAALKKVEAKRITDAKAAKAAGKTPAPTAAPKKK